MVIRVSDKTQNYSKVTKLLVKPIKNMVKGSAQPNLNLKQLSDFQFKFPPLESQARIVHTLDYLNSIYNELQLNISIELESRQKQYEYYRDKLLTFKESNESEVN